MSPGKRLGRAGSAANGGRASRWRLPVVVATGVLLALGGGGALAAELTVSPGAATSGPTALSELPKDVPSDKAAEIRREEAGLMAARAHPSPKNPNYVPPPGPKQPPRKSEISTRGGSPLPAIEMNETTGWQGPSGGEWLVAYAGACTPLGGGRTAGAILLYAEPVDPNAHPLYFRKVGVYRAPAGTGRLTIKRASGQRLLVVGDSGRTLTFDVATHIFAPV